MPAFGHPALWVTITRAWINRNSLAALTATFSADRFYTPAHTCIIRRLSNAMYSPNSQGACLEAARGTVTIQHFNFLSIRYKLQLTHTGWCLLGSLIGFALCWWRLAIPAFPALGERQSWRRGYFRYLLRDIPIQSRHTRRDPSTGASDESPPAMHTCNIPSRWWHYQLPSRSRSLKVYILIICWSDEKYWLSHIRRMRRGSP